MLIYGGDHIAKDHDGGLGDGTCSTTLTVPLITLLQSLKGMLKSKRVEVGGNKREKVGVNFPKEDEKSRLHFCNFIKVQARLEEARYLILFTGGKKYTSISQIQNQNQNPNQ